MWIVPFIWTETGQYKHKNTDDEVGSYHINPDFNGKRIEEREESWTLTSRPLEQDADTKVHKRLGEVYHLFP